jgi:tryptophan halogenase
MGGLDTKVDFEPSFKAVRDRLLANRLLLGFDRLQTDASRDEEIASVCERIGMPSSLLAAFRQGLPDANHVYFGAEKNDRTLVLKAYLEFRDRIEKEIRGAPVAGRSFSLFTGFKWDAFAPARQVVSRYVWHRSLPVPEILERLQATIDPSRHGALLELVQGIVRQASERIAPGEIQYLEVTEEGNPRRSFDLNVYKSGLRLQDLNPELLRALAYYGIPFSRFAPLYQRIKRERLGHLAGGVDREGNDFMTVYYGVHEVHSSQLGSAMVVQEDRPPQPRW